MTAPKNADTRNLFAILLIQAVQRLCNDGWEGCESVCDTDGEYVVEVTVRRRKR